MSITLNLGATDLTTAYSKDYYKPGTTYFDDKGGQYVWGVYVEATVSAAINKVCVPVLSSTNSAMFSADEDDADLQFKDHVGYSPARMTSGKRGWFKCGGRHLVKECSTSAAELPKGTMFRVPTTDMVIESCETRSLSAGITLEAFSTSATSLKSVWLYNFR